MYTVLIYYPKASSRQLRDRITRNLELKGCISIEDYILDDKLIIACNTDKDPSKIIIPKMEGLLLYYFNKKECYGLISKNEDGVLKWVEHREAVKDICSMYYRLSRLVYESHHKDKMSTELSTKLEHYLSYVFGYGKQMRAIMFCNWLFNKFV